MNPYQQPSAFSAPAPRPVPVDPAEPARKRPSGLGAGGVLLAVIALLFGWIPVLGLAMLVPAALAVLLGIVGFAAATVTGRSRRGMPIMATLLGVLALLIPPVSTTLVALAAVPWVYTVGMDQVQIELEHDLQASGIDNDQSERIGQEIGDVLRRFADPGQWREGIALAHRYELITSDFRRDLREIDSTDTDAIAERSNQFAEAIRRLAERYEVDLPHEDMNLVIDSLRKEQLEQVQRWRSWQNTSPMAVIQTFPPMQIDSPHLYQHLDLQSDDHSGCGHVQWSR